MESKRFDDLSRAVATMTSRRGILKGIVGGAVAGVAGVFAGRSDVSAARKRRTKGQICRKPGDCAEGLTCIPADRARQRCCIEGSNWCNGACCETLCDPYKGCTDSFVDPVCYHDCVDANCFFVNNGFNYTVNYTFNNQLQCEEYCAFDVCGIG